MNLLVATPLSADHYDAGHFWVKAFRDLGHAVQIWDYRKCISCYSNFTEVFSIIVFKGEIIEPSWLGFSPKIVYWPDRFERTPGMLEKLVKGYDKVFSPVFPTPEGVEWMPSGWDDEIHVPPPGDKSKICSSIYVGTNNSDYKRETVEAFKPTMRAGNLWDSNDYGAMPPVYGKDLVKLLHGGKVLIDIHQDPSCGVNRKFFEMASCGFTIVDRVPGIEEILGKELASLVCYDPEWPAERKLLFLHSWIEENPKIRERAWQAERKAIQKYTYYNQARRMIQCLKEIRK